MERPVCTRSRVKKQTNLFANGSMQPLRYSSCPPPSFEIHGCHSRLVDDGSGLDGCGRAA
jgi:hypothetical protein